MAHKMKKLTVIVPLYNKEKYIKQCIESIMYQSYRNIDILIIDDGSTDGSYDICRELAEKDKRIHIIQQENKGISETRRTGIDFAKTEYITFVDADDFILQNSYSFAEDAMKKDVDMIFFEISRYFDDNNIKREHHILEEGYYDKSRIKKQVYSKLIWDFSRDTPGIECSQCVRIVKTGLIRCVYETLGNIGLYYGEDVAITYPLYTKIKDMQVINQSFYMHRQRIGAVAPYIKGNVFFDETYRLYKHLLKSFEPYFGETDLERQIEYFYLYSVNLRKIKYNDYYLERHFLFPFDKIEKGESIVLYGAGAVGKSYYAQIAKLDYCREILWVDKNADSIPDDRVQGIACIDGEAYDHIIIAIENKNICKQISDVLIERGVERCKIIY